MSNINSTFLSRPGFSLVISRWLVLLSRTMITVTETLKTNGVYCRFIYFTVVNWLLVGVVLRSYFIVPYTVENGRIVQYLTLYVRLHAVVILCLPNVRHVYARDDSTWDVTIHLLLPINEREERLFFI